MNNCLVFGPGWIRLGTQQEAREAEALAEFHTVAVEAAEDGWGAVERLLDAYRPRVDRRPAWLPVGVSRKQALARWEELLAGGMVQADAAQVLFDEWGVDGSVEPMLRALRRWRKK